MVDGLALAFSFLRHSLVLQFRLGVRCEHTGVLIFDAYAAHNEAPTYLPDYQLRRSSRDASVFVRRNQEVINAVVNPPSKRLRWPSISRGSGDSAGVQIASVELE